MTVHVRRARFKAEIVDDDLIVVEDLDAVRSELAARGVAISDVQQMEPEGTPGSRYCFFHDPDGNTLMLHRRYAPRD